MTGLSEKTTKKLFFIFSVSGLVLQFFFILCFLGFIFYGEMRVNLKESLIEKLRVNYPWIDSVAWVANPSWVPHLFEVKNYDSKALLYRIYEAQSDTFALFEDELHLSSNQKAIFKEYLLPWSERLRLCQGYLAQFGVNFTEECDIYASESMPKLWFNLFKETLFFDMYFYVRGGFVDTFETSSGYLTACNLSPIEVNKFLTQSAFSNRLVKTYKNLGFSNADNYLFSYMGKFEPGTCKTRPVLKFDESVSVYFSSTPADQELSDFVDKELNKGLRKKYSFQPSTFPFVCFNNNPIGFAKIENDICPNHDVYRITSLALKNKDRDLTFQAITTHPILPFLDYKNFNNNYWASSQIDAAKIEAIKFGEIANAQWALSQKWENKISHFLLPANIKNPLGALRPGIYFDEGHRVNYYREPLDIPNEGHLIGINNREIWSEYDVYEELEYHGFSRNAGIKKPIHLAITGYERLHQTRYLFNQQNLPNFINDSGELRAFIDGGMQDLTWGQEWISCGASNVGRGVANAIHWLGCTLMETITEDTAYCQNEPGKALDYENIGECSWKRTQQWAYSSHAYPTGFEIGQVASWFIPVGVNTLKFFKGQKLAKSSTAIRAVSYGTAEALDNTLIEIGTVAPLSPLESKLNRAWIPAGLGFISGAIFHPKLK